VDSRTGESLDFCTSGKKDITLYFWFLMTFAGYFSVASRPMVMVRDFNSFCRLHRIHSHWQHLKHTAQIIVKKLHWPTKYTFSWCSRLECVIWLEVSASKHTPWCNTRGDRSLFYFGIAFTLSRDRCAAWKWAAYPRPALCAERPTPPTTESGSTPFSSRRNSFCLRNSS
jgi:hypothetical protein